MTKIVITGASGNYGRLATDRLIAMGRGADLILISRTPAKLAARRAQGCELRYGDFDRPESLISATRVGARVQQHKAAIDAAVAVLTSPGHDNKAYAITGPNSENFAEVAAMMNDIVGCQIKLVETDDDGMYAMFDAMGIPREPLDNLDVGGIPWNSDDMVRFERAIREGALDICTDDVEYLTGSPARSVRQMIVDNADMLRRVRLAFL